VTNTRMFKGIYIALGVGLAILWVSGLSSPYVPGWFTWLDGVAALGSFTLSGSAQSYDTRGKRVGAPITLAVGLFALWIIGLATGAVNWMCWWTFAFACAFLVTGIAAGGARPIEERIGRKEEEKPYEEPGEDRFRKAG
jgi:hypothetical protein